MYSYESRIRYSETDCEGKLSLPALLNYFQDASTFQSEDLGLGVEYMKEQQKVWVLSSWQIVVERYPVLGENVIIGTLPYDFKGFLGYRNFVMKTRDGELLAMGNTLWSLLDLNTGKPTAPTEDMLSRYELGEKLVMDYAPRKIAVPDSALPQEPIVVKRHHLDTNHHVNNGQYVRIALDSLGKECKIKQLRTEYKKQSYLNNLLTPYISQSENGTYVIVLKDAEDAISCVVEIKTV